MTINKKFLSLIICIPLAIWIVGFCLTVSKVTGNLVTPLTRDVLDVWSIAAVLFFINWIIHRIKKGKKQSN